MWNLICAMTFVAFASASFNPSIYVRNVFAIMKQRLAEYGPVNWALPAFDIELQRSDDNLSISFFRAYFQGLEVLELEDECSLKNLSTVISIECLAQFPQSIFTAYGNLREAMQNVVIRTHVMTTNLLFLLRIEKASTRRLTSFEPMSPPMFDVTIMPKLISSGWEDPVKVEISKWSHSKFSAFLNVDIKWILNDIVTFTPFGGEW